MSMTIEEEIIRTFQAQDGVWIVEQGKTKEAALLKKAIVRIEQLKEDLEDAEALAADWEDSFDEQVAEAVEEYHDKRDDFANAYDTTLKHALNMRNSAKAYVTVCDKFLNEGKNDK